MNCARAEDLIHEALDAALQPRQWLALQEHMARCPACRQLWNQHQAMLGGFEWLAGDSAALPAPELDAFPVTGHEAAPPAPARRVWIGAAALRGLAAAAVIVLAVGLGWMWWSGALRSPTRVVELASPPEPIGQQPALAIELDAASRRRFIAVPQESSRPNVHIVWLYRAASPLPDSDLPGSGATTGPRPLAVRGERASWPGAKGIRLTKDDKPQPRLVAPGEPRAT